MDSHFSELKDNEIIRERLEMIEQTSSYIGTYYSKAWVRKNILQQTDEEIGQINKEIQDEKDAGDIPDEDDI